jgi:hypothetical protein
MGYTTALLVLNVALFLLELALGPSFVKLFAFTPALALAQPWTFLTAAFLHAGLFHLFFNMFALLIFGPLLEHKLGPRTFLGLYLAGALAGNVGYLLTAPNPSVPGLGASGAVFAVLGALAVLEPNLMVFIGFLPLPMYLAAVFWFVTELAFLNTSAGIARGAHVLGLVFGVAFAWLWKKGRLPSNLSCLLGHKWRRVRSVGHAYSHVRERWLVCKRCGEERHEVG